MRSESKTPTAEQSAQMNNTLGVTEGRGWEALDEQEGLDVNLPGGEALSVGEDPLLSYQRPSAPVPRPEGQKTTADHSSEGSRHVGLWTFPENPPKTACNDTITH